MEEGRVKHIHVINHAWTHVRCVKYRTMMVDGSRGTSISHIGLALSLRSDGSSIAFPNFSPIFRPSICTWLSVIRWLLLVRWSFHCLGVLLVTIPLRDLTFRDNDTADKMRLVTKTEYCNKHIHTYPKPLCYKWISREVCLGVVSSECECSGVLQRKSCTVQCRPVQEVRRQPYHLFCHRTWLWNLMHCKAFEKANVEKLCNLTRLYMRTLEI